jgi:hypothetical protein
MIFEQIIIIFYNRVSITDCGCAQIFKLLKKTQNSWWETIKHSLFKFLPLKMQKFRNFHKTGRGASFDPHQTGRFSGLVGKKSVTFHRIDGFGLNFF